MDILPYYLIKLVESISKCFTRTNLRLLEKKEKISAKKERKDRRKKMRIINTEDKKGYDTTKDVGVEIKTRSSSWNLPKDWETHVIIKISSFELLLYFNYNYFQKLNPSVDDMLDFIDLLLTKERVEEIEVWDMLDEFLTNKIKNNA